MRPLRAARDPGRLTKPGRARAGDDQEPVAFADELKAIRDMYGARIEVARRIVSKDERAAALRSLRDQKKVAIAELTRRRKDRSAERRGIRRAAQQEKPEPSN